MDYKMLSIVDCCLASCVALTMIDSAAHAGELFPYNPPATNAALQMQQRVPQQAVGLSAKELERIDALAQQVSALPPAQKQTLRAEVQSELDKAASRYDLRQIRYYGELLRRIDSDR
jgi:hypothetical protein